MAEGVDHEVHPGMELRGRQLPGVVPKIVPRAVPPPPQIRYEEDDEDNFEDASAAPIPFQGIGSNEPERNQDMTTTRIQHPTLHRRRVDRSTSSRSDAGTDSLGFLGTVRKHLSRLFSTISWGNTTSHDVVSMEETIPVDHHPLTSTPYNTAPRKALSVAAPAKRPTPPGTRAPPMTPTGMTGLVPASPSSGWDTVTRSNLQESQHHQGQIRDDNYFSMCEGTETTLQPLEQDLPLTMAPLPVCVSNPNGATDPTGLAPAGLCSLNSCPQHPIGEPCGSTSVSKGNVTSEPSVVNHYTNCTFGSERPATPYTRNRPKMPVFNDKDIDIEAYLANFNAMTENWSSEAKLSLLREKLTGAAGKVLAALDLQGVRVTFETLVQALQKHYIGERSEWVAKLRDIRRQHDESLDDLAFRLTLYSQRAYGKLQSDLGLQFYLALRDGPLGDRLFDCKDMPLEEVLQRAKSFEAHLLATNQPVFERSGSGVDVSAVSGDSYSGDVHKRGTYTRGRGRGRSNFSPRGRGGGQQRYGWNDRRLSNGERACNICGATDHLWRHCEVGKSHFVQSPQDSQHLNPDAVPPQ